MVGTPSSSLIVPVPVTPPMVNGTVSFGSSVVSCVVGTVTVKLVTPAGTVIVPSGFKHHTVAEDGRADVLGLGCATAQAEGDMRSAYPTGCSG